jgi:hypothetical protein
MPDRAAWHTVERVHRGSPLSVHLLRDALRLALPALVTTTTR